MRDITLSVHQAYKGKAPPNWFHTKSFTIHKLYYIKQGNGGYSQNGQKHKLMPGYFYLFPCNLDLEFYNDPNFPIDHIYFDFYSTPPIINNVPLEYKADAHLKSLADFLESTVAAHTTEFDFSDTSDEYIKLLHELLKISLMTLSRVNEIPFMTDKTVSDTIEYIRMNYSQKLTVSTLSSRLGFEENYFIRKFKSLTGTTPYAFLKAYRLRRAKELISSGKTVAETSDIIGYEDPSSLSRALKKYAHDKS